MAQRLSQVFLDANVYFAGSVSPSGASRVILELARRGKIKVFASRLALHEAERNLVQKADPKAVTYFHQFLKKTSIRVIPTPPERILERYESYIHPKDVPILAAAIEWGVDFLITLDRRHFLTPKVLSLQGKTKIGTPGIFLQGLVRH